MSDECTKSGTSLWLMLDLFFMLGLFFELGYLKNMWELNPKLGADIGLIVSMVLVGTFAGVVMLNKGLTSKPFDMRMRVALVATGSIIAFGALLVGATLGIILT
jgi:hypothetical protein